MISICMAYYNRKPQLYNTLKSFKIPDEEIEVIIVDDASDEEHELHIVDLNDHFLHLNIKLIKITKEEKWWHNPCIAFNKSFKKAQGDTILIQNPECYHCTNVLNYISNNKSETDYLTFGCYSMTEMLSAEKILQEMTEEKVLGLPQQLPPGDGEVGWYNHSIYRPVAYHFASAISKKALTELGGFNEKYAFGISFDDDDFIRRIRKNLNVKIIDNQIVLHQWHPPAGARPNFSELFDKNSKLYHTGKQ